MLVKQIDTKRIVCTVCFLNDGRIASALEGRREGGRIKVYSLENSACDIDICAHEDSVTYISVSENNELISASDDGKVKIWSVNKDNLYLKKTLEVSERYAKKAIEISEEGIGACSLDGKIRFWSRSYEKIAEIECGMQVWSFLELKNGRYIISGVRYKDEGKLQIFERKTYKKISEMKDIFFSSYNGLEEIVSRRVFLVGGDHRITIISSDTLQIITSIENEKKEQISGCISSFCEISTGMILCGTQDYIYGISENNGKWEKSKFCEIELISETIETNFVFITSLAFDKKTGLIICGSNIEKIYILSA